MLNSLDQRWISASNCSTCCFYGRPTGLAKNCSTLKFKSEVSTLKFGLWNSESELAAPIFLTRKLCRRSSKCEVRSNNLLKIEMLLVLSMASWNWETEIYTLKNFAQTADRRSRITAFTRPSKDHLVIHAWLCRVWWAGPIVQSEIGFLFANRVRWFEWLSWPSSFKLLLITRTKAVTMGKI